MAAPARQRTYEILDVGRPDPVGRFVDIALITLISLNILAVILESMPELAHLQAHFTTFETVSVVIFSIEYMARLWSCIDDESGVFRRPVGGRLRYMLTPMALIDLLAILPFYLVFFVDFDLRFLRVLRLLRVFKLTRYSASMGLLLQVLRQEARPISAALFVLLLLTIVAASLTYLAEHQAQPVAFGSIPAAMWWAIITMTTIGYGDVVPITAWGKIMGAIIGIIIVGMVALPAGLLASGFTGALRQRRMDYEALVDDVISDGLVAADEEAFLKTTRDNLGISRSEAERILAYASRKGSATIPECPHCGKPLIARHADEDEDMTEAGDG